MLQQRRPLAIHRSALLAIAVATLVGLPLSQTAIARPNPPATTPVRAPNAREAAAKVDQALNQNVNLRPFRLGAQSQGNVIILTGIVNTAAQKALAEDLARLAAPSFPVLSRIRANQR